MLLVLSITFLLGIVMAIMNIYFFREIHLYSIITGFLPLVTVILDNFYSILKKDKRGNIINFTLCLICIICTFGNFFVTRCIDKLSTITDESSYNRILELKDYPNNKKIFYFPKNIPSDAKNVEFRDWTFIGDGQAQGHNGTYLSYISINIYEEEEKLRKIEKEAKYIYNGKDELKDIDSDLVIPADITEWLYKNSNDAIKLIIFDSSLSVDINEYYSYGIAINYSDYEIIYFSEYD